jgi:hypothetical protein
LSAAVKSAHIRRLLVSGTGKFGLAGVCSDAAKASA